MIITVQPRLSCQNQMTSFGNVAADFASNYPIYFKHLEQLGDPTNLSVLAPRRCRQVSGVPAIVTLPGIITLILAGVPITRYVGVGDTLWDTR